MKRIVRSQFSYIPGMGKEKITGKSVTTQGEAYSISELMARARQGSAPDVTRMPYFGEADMSLDDPDFEEVQRSDISEKAAAVERTAEMQKEVRDAQAKAKAKKDEEAKRTQDEKAKAEAARKADVRGGERSNAAAEGEGEKNK